MLRPAGDDDVLVMREWRNQAANREVSLQQHVIGLEEHRAWWQRVQGDPSRRVLVFEVDGDARGIVSFFDLDGDHGSWGFFLDHDRAAADGTAFLLWTRVMREAVAYAFDELGLAVLTGEVLAHNEAVRVMNRRFGFVEGEPETRDVDGRTVEVYPISLRREDRRPVRRRTVPAESE